VNVDLCMSGKCSNWEDIVLRKHEQLSNQISQILQDLPNAIKN